MTRPKIKSALIAIFTLIGTIVLSFGVYSITRLQALNANVDELSENWMPSGSAARNVAANLAGLRIAYRDHVLATTDDLRQKAQSKLDNYWKTFAESVAKYESLDEDRADATLTNSIRQKMEVYRSIGEEIVTAARNNKNLEARDLIYTKMAPVGDDIATIANKLVEINEDGAQYARKASNEVFSTSLFITIAASALSAVLTGLAIWFAFAAIARPIEAITACMRKLADGQIDTLVPYQGRSDEIGHMAAAVEVFRSNALTNERLEREAAAQRELSDQQRQEQTRAAEQRASEMAQATTGLAEGLKHLASGDLSFSLSQAFAGEFESLRRDFNAAVSQLAQTLGTVAFASQQFENGTREISQGADDLSKRTEQQAASLEQTAAALDQITANVTSSSKLAEEARSATLLATESATKSGAIVTGAVDAMHQIEQSSEKVSSIIGVIDEIAFQTNLLALNAGVEAARAGEAGKGFAVVAQEVRELAQRSAEAAKQIKELIRNSSLEVRQGVKLVSETGEALKVIEQYVVTVNRHMDSIASSAREQAIGLAEVNSAVNQMDQVTQQNAAMVEQSNAAGAALASEALKLRDLIDQFRLPSPDSSSTLVDHVPARRAGTDMSSYQRAPRHAMTVYTSGNAALKQTWEEY
jgi:methyl-accepting chemotaxis protein